MAEKQILLQGNEAVVEGAIAAGCRFYAGYPITPSSEIAEGMARRLPQVGGKFIQMEDEIGGMAATIGASLAGLKSMTATSGPGFSLKQENIGFAVMTEIPCVIVNVQRMGPSTGLPTSPGQGDMIQARFGTHGDSSIIALTPSNVKEAFDLTIKAFNFAERFRSPVILLLDEIVGHMRENVKLPGADEIEIINRKRPTCKPEEYFPYQPDEDLIPPIADYGTGYRFHITGLYHDKTGFPKGQSPMISDLLLRLHDKILKYQDEVTLIESKYLDDAEIVVLSYGGIMGSAISAVESARKEGKKVGWIKLITIWPFPDQYLLEVAKKVKAFIIPELNLGQIQREVQRATLGKAEIIGLHRVDGDIIRPEEILDKIREVL
ncbi:2-oxoacid:acceptor oxidoreductase subunit alpha [Anoxybacter fermentans]|nr:2-oxoacid:acceptor oxidoreductase subunit alpha [Anoxybacter fermentans]